MENNPGATPNPLETQDGNLVQSLDPEGRPMVQVPTEEGQKPKKKTGLIVGIIIGLLVLIGGGVAAAILLLGQNNDPVAAAVDKIMRGDTPANVIVDGTIDFVYNSDDSPISQIKIDLESDMIAGTGVNTSKANLVVSLADGNDYAIEFDEVYAESGDLYFKIDGAMDALEESGILNLLDPNYVNQNVVDCASSDADTANCLTDDVMPVNCPDGEDDCETIYPKVEGTTGLIDDNLAETLGVGLEVLEIVDGEWLHISTSELSQMSDSFTIDALQNSKVSCIVNLVKDVNKNSDSAVELYSNNPFITSTDQEITIASAGNPVYKLGIDSEKFAAYVNSIQNAQLSSDIYDCLDLDDTVSVTKGDIDEMVEKLPAIYAEVNSDYDFTRLYVESEVISEKEEDPCYCPEGTECSTCLETDSTMVTTVKMDLRFSYPESINIEEPAEYTDFSDLITQIMMSMYDFEYAE